MMATEQSTAPVPRRLLYRVLLSLAVALVVFGVSVAAAYQTYLHSAIRYPQSMTLSRIGSVAKAVQAYRAANHSLPAKLSDLKPEWTVDEKGNPVDWWRRPLHYRIEGSRFRISSYGEDDRPGGVGLNYDLSSDDLGKDGGLLSRMPTGSRPTFRQSLTDSRPRYGGTGQQMLLACVLAGVMAFVLGFVVLGAGTVRASWGSVLFALSLTMMATLFVGAIMASLDAPTGH